MTITAEEQRMDDGPAGLSDEALREYNARDATRSELSNLRVLAAIVRDDLVPIVEMSSEANDPSEDIYLVLHHVKDVLRSLPQAAHDSGNDKETR